MHRRANQVKNLALRIGDKNVLNYQARVRQTQAVKNLSAPNGKVRQSIYTDPSDPVGSSILTKTIDDSVDASNGQITDGANGVYHFVYITTDLTALVQANAKTYYFSTMEWDSNGDPVTVEPDEESEAQAECILLPQLVSNAP
jgi:hypothetical protein